MAFTELPFREIPPLASVQDDQLVSSILLRGSTSKFGTKLNTSPFDAKLPGQLDARDSLLHRFVQRDPYAQETSTSTSQQRFEPSPPQLFESSRPFKAASQIKARRHGREDSQDSSSSSSSSTFWDDQVPSSGADADYRVRFRGEGGKARLTDYAYLDARHDAPTPNLSEAVHEISLADELDKGQERQLAPVHPAHQVALSLLTTASTGTSSDHFQWDEASASFTWSRTAQYRLDIKASKRALHRYQQRRVSRASENEDESQEAQPVLLQPWVGSERIQGWSLEASESLIRPFLDIGALLRRLDNRLADIRRDAAPRCKEAPAFAFALDSVLAWFKGELRAWATSWTSESQSSEIRSAAILNAQAGLETPLSILKALGNLLSVGQPRAPPFRELSWLATTHGCLSQLHAHLAASMASAASPLTSSVLAYLLDQTSSSWRTQVAKWIGYPGFSSTRTGELDDDIIALNTFRGSKQEGGGAGAVPWSGAEIDWSFDERGEDDIGYTLRPSAVPSFLSFRSARDFLEAGRALRLLKKAAPKGHPLVRLWTLDGRDSDLGRPLGLPTWLWSPREAEHGNDLVNQRAADLKRQIGKWRRQRTRNTHTKHSSSSSFGSSPLVSHRVLSDDTMRPALQAAMLTTSVPLPVADLSIEDKFAKLSALFAAAPATATDLSPDNRPERKSPDMNTVVPPSTAQATLNVSRAEDSVEDAVVLYLARATQSQNGASSTAIQRASFDYVTQSSLVAPFQTWARLINASLISVFFQDLGLGTYLETCKQFLLLGSHHFERQVISSLFEVDRRSVFDSTTSAGRKSDRAVIAMNRRLTADGTWPPNDSILSSGLNTAVIETVSGMRQAHEESLKARSSREDGGEDAVSLAYKDLDERLSFAVIEPPSSASSNRKKKPTWMDPSSIDALDWLTLSFHPPPLVSPLLTQLAQARYQRLWNLLLRIKRCKVAMRSAFQDTFKSASASFTLDFRVSSLLHQFRWETNHFLDSYGGFVQEVGIEKEWTRFMQRLERVKREVSDELGSRSRAANTSQAGTTSDEEDSDDLDDEALGEEEKQALMTSNLELKDVFSLARYHERVLDRMLESTFLKSKQRGIAQIINNLLQCILDFAQMCSDFHNPAPNTEAPTYQDFANLHKFFRSRMDTFIQALLILKDRRPSDDRVDSVPNVDASLPKRRKDIEQEKQRLAEDELEDLRQLDTDAKGKGVQQVDNEGVFSIEILLTRLNASGFYAELD